LRALDGGDEAELRLDDAGVGGRAAELRGDGLVELDEILDRQVSDPAGAVSR
jgi:hypothetical protein